MQCDECGKPANVHEIRVENGMKTERHLCSECAAQAGLTAQEAHVDAPTNPVEMIKQVLAAGPEMEVRAAPAVSDVRIDLRPVQKNGIVGLS